LNVDECTPAVSSVAACAALAEALATASGAAVEVNRAGIALVGNCRENYVTRAASAARTGVVRRSAGTVGAADVNQTAELNRIADEDDGRATLAANSATGAALTSRRSTAGPGTPVAQEGLILPAVGCKTISTGASTGRASQASIDNRNAADHLRALAVDAGSFAATTSAASAAEIAAAADAAANGITVADDSAIDCASPRGSNNEWPVPTRVHHGRPRRHVKGSEPDFVSNLAGAGRAAVTVRAISQPLQPGGRQSGLRLRGKAYRSRRKDQSCP